MSEQKPTKGRYFLSEEKSEDERKGECSRERVWGGKDGSNGSGEENLSVEALGPRDLWGQVKSQRRPKRDHVSSIHEGQVHKASKEQHV